MSSFHLPERRYHEARVPSQDLVPRVATYTVAYRALLDVVDSGKPVRVMIDLVAIGQGRAELMLITTAPYAIRGPVVPAEIRLARLLVSRVPT